MRSTRKRFQLLIYHEASEKRSFLFTGRLHSPYIYIFFLSLSMPESEAYRTLINFQDIRDREGRSKRRVSRNTADRHRAKSERLRSDCRETSLHGNEIWQENHVTWIVVNPTVLYPRTIEGISVFRRCVCRNTRFEKRLRKL